MTQEQWTKAWKFAAAVALALSAFATTMAGIALWAPAEEAVPRDYQCDVYTEQGCAKFVVASGGEIEVQSGGTVDFQSGSTIGLGAPTVFTATYITAGDDLTTTDTLNVDGDFDLDGDGFDVDITSGFSIDADAASNINVAGANVTLTLESEAGTIIIKGDEATADAIHLDANETVTTGIDIDVGSVSGLTIDGGLVNIGGGSCGVADADNDVCIAGVLEVDDEFELDGALDADSTANIAGDLTLQALLLWSFADETITDGEWLTPTLTVYNLDSGGAVTMTLGACAYDGQLLILVGDDGNDITINDTNIRTNDGGVQVINQFDVITWVCIDAEWVEVSESNNS